ncbi:hypothetical protein EMIHUDRAFT_95020 [Emiliania huxleyi CCMP1516]|uniref:3'-5' exonuclease domain-containing protein n=2 Tax=Emiliania huxleyi TaxID=2903 RepID=A0A0D3L1B1_EMIH1|nr:hypothetical protein EMIHUDRAFT_95020 [Emiliania huxleyi CCMP1516]EOD41796.1 hypothetical protein EMIHUDRAFT_95020 [Emiliania huxleyi CCMP1516]|eukprot:XP_005794225.1 hypothetical protein EMIHUDRAFT_95020 [Emiliania huxleyi CCMP1516]
MNARPPSRFRLFLRWLLAPLLIMYGKRKPEHLHALRFHRFETEDDVEEALSRLGFESCRALGLDVEARPTFRRSGGSNPVDTIQLCSDQACAVVSLGRAARLPPLLSRLVASASVLKFGAGVGDDIKLLAGRFPEAFSAADGGGGGASASACVELAVLAPLTGAPPLPIGLELDKPKRIQMSDWSRVPLSAPQIQYAALDAAVSRWLAAVLLGVSHCEGLAAAAAPHAAAAPYAGLGGGGATIATLLRVQADGSCDSLAVLPPAARRIFLAAAERRDAERLAKGERKRAGKAAKKAAAAAAAAATTAAGAAAAAAAMVLDARVFPLRPPQGRWGPAAGRFAPEERQAEPSAA